MRYQDLKLINHIEDTKESVFEESRNTKKYYRITYNDEGIYEALKKKIGIQEWKKLLKSKALTWLPKPPVYTNTYYSYFTKLGFDTFNKLTLPIMKTYIDETEIKIDTFSKIGKIVYEDKYQVVAESVVTESVFEEKSNEDKKSELDDIYTAEDLYNWMHKNIKYHHSGKLRSPEEVLRELKGDCHDQALFEHEHLKSQYNLGRIFMIEYYSLNQPGGSTHTLLWYSNPKDGKFYWFENAWGDQSGIHGPYKSIQQLKDDVASKWKYSGKNDKLFMKALSTVKPGMTLGEYVNANIPDGVLKATYTKESVFEETTSERAIKLPSGDKMIDLGVFHETPYGEVELLKALNNNPWFGADYHMMENEVDKYAEIINAYVKPNDDFIILGDLDPKHEEPDIDNTITFLKRLNCKKVHLILGNNDCFKIRDYVLAGFKSVTNKIQWNNIVITHFPRYVGKDEVNIHGHMHGAGFPENKGKSAYWYADPNNCIDVWRDDFKPQRLNDLLKKHHKKICDTNITYSKSSIDARKVSDEINTYKDIIYREILCVNNTPVSYIVVTKNSNIIIKTKSGYPKKVYEEKILSRFLAYNKNYSLVENFQYVKESGDIKDELEIVTEESVFEESIETALSMNPFKKEITLYHGTPIKSTYINPKSRNFGTRFSNPRFSSFWADNIEYAKSFALFRALENTGYPCVFDKELHICMKVEAYNNLMNDEKFKFQKFYVYQKTFPTKDLGRGHSQYLKEYTFDLPVRPEKEYIFTYDDLSDMIENITPLEENEWDDFMDDMKKYYNKFKGSILYYSFKHYQELHKKYRNYWKESDDMEGDLDDIIDELFVETTVDSKKVYFKEHIAPRVDATLSKPENVRKFNQFVNAFINRNIMKLTKSGPCDMIAFTDVDHKALFDLFGFEYTIDNRPKVTSPNEITDMINTFSKEERVSLKFFASNPSQVLLYYVIRYFTMHNDSKSLNSALSIYALCVYPLMFSKYFKYGVMEPIMQYTIDNLTDKFIIKKSKHLFAALLYSIQNSYKFHKSKFSTGNDAHMIAWVERIRNDQNSLFKKIANEYMKNWKEGNAAKQTNEQFDNDTPIIDEIENATTAVQNIVQKVTLPIIESGVDLIRAEAAAKIGGVSVSDCRFFLTLIISDKNVDTIQSFIESILFLYLYEEKRTERDIRSQYFLSWAASIFKKTNSKNKNINNINSILNKWAEETGVHKKFAREASRINYKKSIFFYIILCIQKAI